MKTLIKASLVLGLILAAMGQSVAETGMCLVVGTANSTEDHGVDYVGNIQRIDLKDGKVINFTGSLGVGRFPRFSPSGDSFAYINKQTVKICDLNGKVLRQFQVNNFGELSYTVKGIYICEPSAKSFHLYDPSTGKKISTTTFKLMKSGGYVSQNDSYASILGPGDPWTPYLSNMSTGAQVKCGDGQGCSACPSQSGTYTTKNLGDHTKMAIYKNDGKLYKFFRIDESLGLPRSDWAWNRQVFAGNSDAIVCIPAGEHKGAKYSALIHFIQPWIYNFETGEKFPLYEKKDYFYQPYDYFTGKIPGGTTPPPPPAKAQFTSPNTASATAGQPFGYKFKYDTAGCACVPQVTYLQKPLWLNSMGDSVFGVPTVAGTQTLTAALVVDKEGHDTLEVTITVKSVPNLVRVPPAMQGIHRRAGVLRMYDLCGRRVVVPGAAFEPCIVHLDAVQGTAKRKWIIRR